MVHSFPSTGLQARLTELIEPVCAEAGFELVAVQFRRESHGQVLRVVIYNPQGITLDDCSAISRELSYLLDVEDVIDQAYCLEVSSPGLDWPLTDSRDFARIMGQKVTVEWRGKGGIMRTVGTVEAVDDQTVQLAVDGEKVVVDLAGIKKARQVIEI